MSQYRKDFEYRPPKEDPPYEYWVYASPVSGRYYATQNNHLVVFESDTVGKAWEPYDRRLRQMIGHWLTGDEVRDTTLKFKHPHNFWVQKWENEQELDLIKKVILD